MTMRKDWIFAFAFTLASLISINAQKSDSLSLPGFKLLRAAEDYSFLKDHQGELSVWDQLKYLKLGKNKYLSIGGDTRFEFQSLSNQDWIPENDDSRLFIRFMAHADLHLGSRFRWFTQLKNGFAFGVNGPESPLDADQIDLHQSFLSIDLNAFRFEVGRQELIYGSRRLISVREGTNIRQSFDGARLIWETSHHRADLLFYAYNPQRTGAFDNRLETNQLIWGGYYVHNSPSRTHFNFDLYYLGLRSENPRFEEASNIRELRHSVGVRHWGEKASITYNNEAIVQFGAFGDGDILAWTISTELYYAFESELSPRLGLKAEIISGDKDAGDGDLETFNALYPRGGYFGLLAVVGPANLIDLHPSFQIEPFPFLGIELDWDVFWRHQLSDGIYFPSGRLNLPGSASDSQLIGNQAGARISIPINRNFEFEASYFYFIAGDFVNDVAGGANFSQFGCSFSGHF